MSKKQFSAEQLLGILLQDAFAVVNEFTCDFMDQVSKGDIKQVQDMAVHIDADLKQLYEDIEDICERLNVSEVDKVSPLRPLRGRK